MSRNKANNNHTATSYSKAQLKKYWQNTIIVRFIRWLTTEFIGNSVYAFFVIMFVVVSISVRAGFYNTEDWYFNVLSEAHGMVLDILVIGVGVALLNKYSEKRRDISRYKEEIDDFRHWKSDEAAYKIAGNARRLSSMGVTKIDLSECYLRQASFRDIDLTQARLQHADVEGADLAKANLFRASIWKANLSECMLVSVNLKEANLENTNLEKAYMAGANLQNAVLYNANLKDVDLFGAKLVSTNLRGANLQRAKLFDADLSGADLVHADLRDVNFTSANLTGANLKEAKFFDDNIDQAAKEKAMRLGICNARSLSGALFSSDIKNLIDELRPHLLRQ